jgi:hypothetical protein
MNSRPPPVGYGFHPTDEELVTYYLRFKMHGGYEQEVSIIAEANVCDYEPWVLPGTCSCLRVQCNVFFSYHFPIFSLFSNLQFVNQQQIMQSLQQLKSQTTQSVISSVLAVTSTQIATGLIGQLKLDTGKSQARIV